MKLVITGATGLIGHALSVKALRQGHTLNIISRDPLAAKAALTLPAQYFGWDQVSEALEDSDAVIHLAGENVAGGRWSQKRKRALQSSRLDSSLALVTAMEKLGDRGPKVRLSASAVGIYGDRADETLDEASPKGQGFLAQLCHDWETTWLDGQDQRSGRSACLRIGVVLSQEGGALKAMLPIFRAGLAGNLGSGAQYMPWIHIDDVVGLFLHALTEPVRGVLNAVAPEPMTNAGFTRALARTLSRPAIFAAPKFALKLALGEMSQILLHSQRVVSTSAKGFRFKHPSLVSAFENLFDLGLEHGLRRLQRHQWLPLTPEKLFPFFADARNLEQLTPPWLNFKVMNQSAMSIGRDSCLDYQLKVHGLPLRWRTRILDWSPPSSFVDIAERSPYRLWHHSHVLEPLQGGTLMTDTIHYALPLGMLGDASAGLLVERDVTAILKYRVEKARELFGGPA